VTWPQHFKNHGYYSARVSKIYHMGVPGGIEGGGHGADDAASWTERFNSPGPEWKAPGNGETLESNPDGKRPVVGGNTFVVVEAEGNDLVHSDGKTAAKACALIDKHKGEPFFLAVGFVRPHVPFVAPAKYYEPFLPYSKMKLPPKIEGNWDDIPKAGINYKTSVNMKMDIRRQKKAVGGSYASVAFMDAQVGKVLAALKKSGVADRTIVIFTSDHGYHLGEHDFWAKVSLRDESAQVPLIISVLDLYPTLASLCSLPAQPRLQGKDISPMLQDPKHKVRTTAFSVAPSRKGFLLRDKNWAYIQYGEDAKRGIELFDMKADPNQYTNLANAEAHQKTVAQFKARLAAKLKALRDNDLKQAN
jgi:iduronate 2-sulfatase